MTIRNNTSQIVIDYGYFVTVPGTSNGGGAVVLRPGQSFGESEFANEGVDQDRITSVGGRTLGCLPFQFSENPPVPFEVDVTEMVPCRNWGDSESKVDWPDAKYSTTRGARLDGAQSRPGRTASASTRQPPKGCDVRASAEPGR